MIRFFQTRFAGKSWLSFSARDLLLSFPAFSLAPGHLRVFTSSKRSWFQNSLSAKNMSVQLLFQLGLTYSTAAGLNIFGDNSPSQLNCNGKPIDNFFTRTLCIRFSIGTMQVSSEQQIWTLSPFLWTEHSCYHGHRHTFRIGGRPTKRPINNLDSRSPSLISHVLLTTRWINMVVAGQVKWYKQVPREHFLRFHQKYVMPDLALVHFPPVFISWMCVWQDYQAVPRRVELSVESTTCCQGRFAGYILCMVRSFHFSHGPSRFRWCAGETTKLMCVSSFNVWLDFSLGTDLCGSQMSKTDFELFYKNDLWYNLNCALA